MTDKPETAEERKKRRKKREEDALRPQTHDSAPLRRQTTSEPLEGTQAAEELRK